MNMFLLSMVFRYMVVLVLGILSGFFSGVYQQKQLSVRSGQQQPYAYLYITIGLLFMASIAVVAFTALP